MPLSSALLLSVLLAQSPPPTLPGWNEERRGALVVLTLAEGKDKAQILVSALTPTPKDPRATLAAQIAGTFGEASLPIVARGSYLYATGMKNGVRVSYVLGPGGNRDGARLAVLACSPDLIARGEAGLAKLTGLPPEARATSGAPLIAASLGGARVYVRYHYTGGGGDGMDYQPLVLFADGTAAREVPVAAPAFSSAAWRAALPAKDLGTWKASSGGGYALTFPDGAVRLKAGSGGLVDAADGAKGKFDVYFAAPAKSDLVGRWRRVSVSSVAGTSGGSVGALEFRADGSFSGSRQGFATNETASSVGAARVASGRWRIDGPLLTREESGKRTVTLAFRMPEWDGGDVLIGGERWEPAGT